MANEPVAISIADALADARAAYADLLSVAEEIEDEWSETNDLALAWQRRIDEVDALRGAAEAPAALVDAVAALADEVRSIGDPHRAIDWLSTFPQVLLMALGEPL